MVLLTERTCSQEQGGDTIPNTFISTSEKALVMALRFLKITPEYLVHEVTSDDIKKEFQRWRNLVVEEQKLKGVKKGLEEPAVVE